LSASRDEFLSRWLSRRDVLAKVGALVDGARLIDELLADLDVVRRAELDLTLTLEEAARESGYSADHLGRLVRDGRIPNAGRHHAPRIRRADLPKRPRRSFATSAPLKYDPSTDARTLVSRRKGGQSAFTDQV